MRLPSRTCSTGSSWTGKPMMGIYQASCMLQTSLSSLKCYPIILSILLSENVLGPKQNHPSFPWITFWHLLTGLRLLIWEYLLPSVFEGRGFGGESHTKTWLHSGEGEEIQGGLMVGKATRLPRKYRMDSWGGCKELWMASRLGTPQGTVWNTPVVQNFSHLGAASQFWGLHNSRGR